jgi:hypothetical protein
MTKVVRGTGDVQVVRRYSQTGIRMIRRVLGLVGRLFYHGRVLLGVTNLLIVMFNLIPDDQSSAWNWGRTVP